MTCFIIFSFNSQAIKEKEMKKFKVGIIGCGRISPFHGMPAKAQECVNLVACCDVDIEKAKDRAKLFGCKKVYTDFEEMIKKEKLDVVHICLPHYLHSPVAVRALELGCNVLTEKPMAISMKQAKAMIDAEKKSGKTLGVIFQNRYNAGSQLVRKCLDSVILGKIKAANSCHRRKCSPERDNLVIIRPVSKFQHFLIFHRPNIYTQI